MSKKLHKTTILLCVAGASAALLLWACGTTTQVAAPVDAGSVDVELGVTRAPGCPYSMPEAGAACDHAPSFCEYGADPHCTTVFSCLPDCNYCTSGTWIVSYPPDPSCAGNPAGCPTQFGVGVGQACPVQGSCTYAEGRCACLSCAIYPASLSTTCNACGVFEAGLTGPDADAGNEWFCDLWPVGPGCPQPRPYLGTACDMFGYCGGGWPICPSVPSDPEEFCGGPGGFWGSSTGGP
jgi:hypothetical protein